MSMLQEHIYFRERLSPKPISEKWSKQMVIWFGIAKDRTNESIQQQLRWYRENSWPRPRMYWKEYLLHKRDLTYSILR